jgi:GGDEF domain-containing protein
MSARSRAPIESLCKVAATLSGLRSIERVGEVIRDAALELVGSDGTSVLLGDGRGLLHPHPALLLDLRGEEGLIEASAAGWALRNRCPAVLLDAARDTRAPLAATPVVSLAAVPMQTGSPPAPLGTIEFCWSERHAVTREELHRMRALAELTALALYALQRRGERATLADRAPQVQGPLDRMDPLGPLGPAAPALSDRAERAPHSRLLFDAAARLGSEADALALDALTGLHSLRGLLTLGEALLHQGRSEQRPICVLYAEITGTSELQERFGDGCCEPMIGAAAQALRLAVPAGELVARVRGGELCAVLRGSPRDGAQLVSRLSRLSRLCTRGGKAPVLRIAVVRDDGDPSTHLESLVQRAGSLLQVLKQRRSERVFTADAATLRLWRAAHPVAARRSPSRPCAAASQTPRPPPALLFRSSAPRSPVPYSFAPSLRSLSIPAARACALPSRGAESRAWSP